MPDERPQLTERQQRIYDYIREQILSRGYGPTVREIGNRFGIRSPNGVMCHLKALERKGLIRREAHMSRAIELTENPNTKIRELCNSLITAWDSGALTAPAESQTQIQTNIESLRQFIAMV
ncbi:MAG: hypothetical protein MK102_19335 [Fuerstiella sp.]|nr:hypothetical protein [Fuerstiella sp.]